MQSYHKFILCVIIVVAVTMLFASTGLPKNTDSDIENMKVAFIYNFTKYINLDLITEFYKKGSLGLTVAFRWAI